MLNKVLVIDDAPFIFKMIKKILEPHGYEIVGHAMDGKIGLEMFQQFKPNAITLDITMPVMDGLETAKQLMIKDPTVKIVMLSAMGDKDLIDTAKRIGVKYFLSKPFKPDELVNVINTLLK